MNNIERGITGESLLPNMDKWYPQVTAKTAVEAYKLISVLHDNYTGELTKENVEDWKQKIDAVAARTMSESLHTIPFSTKKVGSEGDKEAQDGPHYARIAAASANGSFGIDIHSTTC